MFFIFSYDRIVMEGTWLLKCFEDFSSSDVVMFITVVLNRIELVALHFFFCSALPCSAMLFIILHDMNSA